MILVQDAQRNPAPRGTSSPNSSAHRVFAHRDAGRQNSHRAKVPIAERDANYDEYKTASAKSSTHRQARRIRSLSSTSRAEAWCAATSIRANLSAMATASTYIL